RGFVVAGVVHRIAVYAGEADVGKFFRQFLLDPLGAQAEEAELFGAGGTAVGEGRDGQAIVALELAGVEGFGVSGAFGMGVGEAGLGSRVSGLISRPETRDPNPETRW